MKNLPMKIIYDEVKKPVISEYNDGFKTFILLPC